MTLTLRIVNRTALENGSPTELVLRDRGAIIGRSMTCEWSLPDDTRTLSGRHCEIQYRQDDYFLIDDSTNGTFLGDSAERIAGAHKIGPGERFRLGPYIIEARLSGPALERYRSAEAAVEESRKGPEFLGWDDVPGTRPSAQKPAPQEFAADGGWEMPGAARERSSGWSEDDSKSTHEPSADDIFDTFAGSNKVDWSNASWTVDPKFDPFAVGPDTEGGGFAPLAPQKPPPDDGFAPIEPGIRGHDNSSGDFPEPSRDPFGGPLNPGEQAATASDPFGGPLDGGAQPAPASDPFGGPLGGESAQPTGKDPFGGPLNGAPPDDPPAPLPDLDTTVPPRSPQDPVAQQAAPPQEPQAAPVAAPPSVPPDAVYAALLGAIGVPSNQVETSPDEAAAKAGRMLRHLLAGLMILLEARARAKDEMGASATQLRFDGNNPLKFARNVDQALQMMLNPKLRGYMEAEQAIEDSYRDLQAHQIATLKAMQGALRETINRFSPAAISERTESSGLLAKVLPGQREAALWKAYEKQFSGVAQGSAEAFLEVFSKEFRKAYEDAVNTD
ncbi:type VI secretion system-associated FHA domain protein TagH [Erythrobacter sp. JK5]|uniref:type VI secretion system-associated FHA domain protein TagH n=1 Tax=Erythrobacter sp. JK5 TaxID=2829500 RepID=UPI001BA8D646|nr:type VI secretion system-associated FHA domain protein TagH [Erythrobacter sp. JK5]QUL36780.1 type VI secretion system-associated FHA domain protein TagH [Erythrobacter sp. JK5]